MIRMKDRWRPTVFRTNARYRGANESIKYGNFLQEIVHDIKFLSFIFYGSSPQEMFGHNQLNRSNRLFLLEGESETIHSNISQEAVIQKRTEQADVEHDLKQWLSVGGGSVSENEGVFLLEGGSLTSPSGIQVAMDFSPGDHLSIQFKARLISGEGLTFSVGSPNLNSGEGDMENFKLPTNSPFLSIEKRLQSSQEESAFIAFYAHNIPEQLSSVAIEIKDIEIYHFKDQKLSSLGLNSNFKPRLEHLNLRLKQLKENL